MTAYADRSDPSRGDFFALVSVPPRLNPRHACLLFYGRYVMKIIAWKTIKASMLQPYSRQHILRMEKENRFPKRVRLGNGPRSRCGWVEAEIAKWIADRVDDR